MEYTAETARTARSIAGFTIAVIQPFTEGQPLTEQTAAMLNQTLGENFSNNLRAKLTAGKPSEVEGGEAVPFTDEEAQAIADEYMRNYEPGVRSGGGGGTSRVVDPIEREARAIAKAKVLEVVKAKGLKQKDVPVAELVEKLFDKNRDALLKEGAKIVKARENASKNSVDLLEGIEIG